MTHHLVATAALFALVLSRVSAVCDSRCKLRFCDGANNFALFNLPDLPFTSAVCFRGRRVRVAQSAEALVNGSRISSVLIPGTKQRVARTFFKLYSTPRGAAVGAQSAPSALRRALEGSCIAVPVARVLVGDENVDVSECVSFRVSPMAPTRKLRPAVPLPMAHAPSVEAPRVDESEGDDVRPGSQLDYSVALKTTHMRRELMVLVDATGSMRELLKPILRGKGKAFEDILAQSVFSKFGLAEYRDELDGFRQGYKLIRKLGSTAPQVARSLFDINFNRGGDYEEAALHALHAVAEEPWTPGSLRAVLWLGDASSHEPSCAGGRVVTRKSAADALKKAHVRVIAVDLAKGERGLNAPPKGFGCNGTRKDIFAEWGQASYVATRSGGLMLNAFRTNVDRVVRDALQDVSLHVTVDASRCKGMLKVSKFDASLGDDAKVSVVVTKKGCTRKQGFTCILSFRANGAVVAKLPVRIKRVIGC